MSRKDVEMDKRPYRGDRGPGAPKPYEFVSFPSQVVRQEVPGHHVLKPELHTGTLTFHLRTVTPLFVSSGQAALSEDLGLRSGGVVQAHYRIGDQLAIPASSLKGAVRSVAEAVSASCLGVTQASRRDLPDAFERPCTRRAACPACTLFGMGGKEAYMGQVRFEDALLQEGQTMIYRLPALYRPRLGAPVYRDRSGRYKGRKFYTHGRPHPADEGGESEVIRPDSLLVGQVAFTNLTEDQLGLLLYALGWEKRFLLKLGGGKPACLGSLLTEPVRLVLRDGREAFLGGECAAPAEMVWEGDTLKDRVQGYIAGARQRGTILARQAGELERVLHFDPSALEECPTGAY